MQNLKKNLLGFIITYVVLMGFVWWLGYNPHRKDVAIALLCIDAVIWGYYVIAPYARDRFRL